MVSSNEEISSDLPLAGTEKNHLRKAFNILKTHAAVVANFTLQWQDLEDHFVFIHNSIQTKLEEYQHPSSSKDTLWFANLESQANSQENHSTPTLKSEPVFRRSDFSPDIERHIKSNETESTPNIESQPKAEEPHSNSLREPGGKGEESHSPSKKECFPGEADINEVPIEEGKAFLAYLIENSKHHESIRITICNALKASTNPGKLVLETIRWFYPMEEDYENMNYDLNVIRRSCVLLLEEMMNAKLSIEPQEKDEAKELLLAWMAKIKMGVENSLEVLGLLLLVGAFGLKDCFDADEILSLFNGVIQRRKAPELFRSIGFEDKAPEFIEKLISQKKRIEALRFIYEFGLVGKFSPVTILKDHLMEAKVNAKTNSKKGQNSQQSRDMAAKKEMVALSDVIQCIEKYKLGSKYSPDDLRDRLQHLRKQVKKRKERKADATAPSPKDQKKQQSGNKWAASNTDSKWNRQKRHKANYTGVSMEDAPSSSVNQSAAHHLMQPPHYQRGLHSSQDTPCFPSPRNPMLPSASRYASVGMTSTIHAMQSSHPQSVSSFLDHGVHFLTGSSGRHGVVHSTPDAKQVVLPVGSFGLVTSTHATQNKSLAARPHNLSSGSVLSSGQYQLSRPDYVTPQTRLTLETRRMNIPATTGSFGSSIAPLHGAFALNVNATNRSIGHYSGDTPGASTYASGYGGTSQRPPSIYHL